MHLLFITETNWRQLSKNIIKYKILSKDNVFKDIY